MPSWEFSFCFFISYAHICTSMRRHLKETIPSSSITWSEMGKQNIQAKAWFPYHCICRTKKIHRTDRIHSISYKKLYLSFLLYWAFVREVSIKLYVLWIFSYDRYNDIETRLKRGLLRIPSSCNIIASFHNPLCYLYWGSFVSFFFGGFG